MNRMKLTCCLFRCRWLTMPSRLGLENRKSGVSNQQFITDVMGQVPSPVTAAFIKLSWHGLLILYMWGMVFKPSFFFELES